MSAQTENFEKAVQIYEQDCIILNSIVENCSGYNTVSLKFMQAREGWKGYWTQNYTVLK